MPSDEWDAKAREFANTFGFKGDNRYQMVVNTIAAFGRAIDTAAERRGIERAAKMHHEVAERLLAESKNEQFNESYRSRARISAHEHAQHALEILALAPPMADAGPTEPAGEKGEG